MIPRIGEDSETLNGIGVLDAFKIYVKAAGDDIRAGSCAVNELLRRSDCGADDFRLAVKTVVFINLYDV